MKNKKNTDILGLVEQRIRFLGLSPGAAVIAGVSGGPDSTALAHLLHGLQYKLGFHLHLAHFNHRWRASAAADQRFVEALARRLNLPCTSVRASSPPSCKAAGRRGARTGSLEEEARLQRFDFFIRLAGKLNTRFVALGHTQDDLAETVLMRLLRGTGLSGMRAILPQRTIGGVHFLRPLLKIRKKEILEFLRRNQISYRIDPTNRRLRFLRNKVRLELLPLLEKEYNPNIRQLLCNLAETSAADYDYLEREAGRVFDRLVLSARPQKAVSLSPASWVKYPQALRRMVLRIAVERIQGSTRRLTLAHMEEVEDLIENRPCGSVVHLPGGVCVLKEKNTSAVSKKHLIKFLNTLE